MLALLLSLLATGLFATGPVHARPTPTPTPTPTEPLPIDIVVDPDDDVLGGPGLLVGEGLSRPPQIPATGWMLVDVDSGVVYAARNARAKLMPASTLKLLTALTMSPRLPDDNQEYTATPQTEAVDGTRVGLVAGSVYRVSDLLNGLLMSSGNDTAVALSDLGGGDGPTSTLMMAEAARLGATDTVAVNTSGLDGPGQVTSARDLALFGRAVLNDPRLAPIVARPVYDFPKAGMDFGPGREYYPIYNHNRMVGSYPGTLGLKTGFTQAARGSFVGAAERDGRRLQCTMLHSEGRESDYCIQLLDWAFGQAPPTSPVTTLGASVRASAPPVVVADTPAGVDPDSQAAADAESGQDGAEAIPAPAGSFADLPAWMGVVIVLVGFGLAAGLGAWLLGRSATRATDAADITDG